MPVLALWFLFLLLEAVLFISRKATVSRLVFLNEESIAKSLLSNLEEYEVVLPCICFVI